MDSHIITELDHDTPDPHGGKTIAQMKAEDKYDDHEIEKVESIRDGSEITGYKFDTKDGFGFIVSRDRAGARLDEVEPEPGQTVRLYGNGFGYPFHGCDVEGEELFWWTPLERDAERVRWLAQHDRKQREQFVESQEQLDADFEALPEPLKARIQRFRDGDPGFRVTSEGYEMFCCVEAAKFAKAAREATAGPFDKWADGKDVAEFWNDEDLRRKVSTGKYEDGWWAEDPGPENPAQRWLLWVWALSSEAYDYDTKRQLKLLGADDGHSGNTFGGAMMLAVRYIQGKDV